MIRGFRTIAAETAEVPPLALRTRMYSARYSRRVELLQESLANDALREALTNSERQA